MNHSRSAIALLLLFILCAGCVPGGEGERDGCRILGEYFDPAELFDFQPTFCEDSSGSGDYGRWTLDALLTLRAYGRI